MVYAIRGYTGAMGVDGWDRTAWQKEFMESDVLVMTCEFTKRHPQIFLKGGLAQIFLNILRHAHWTMQQVMPAESPPPGAQFLTGYNHRF